MRLHSMLMPALLVFCLPAYAEEKPAPPPAEALIGPKPKPIEPPTAEAIEKSIRRGVEFLLKRQYKDGSWGSASTSRVDELDAPIPGRIRPLRRP